MIRVLVVDDHAIVRQGLRRILDDAPEMTFVGEAANGVEALKMMRTHEWDVVLLDISMPEMDGIDTLKHIMCGNKNARVLMLSMHPEDLYAVRLMKAGASGYMLKDAAPERLMKAVLEVVSGRKYISPRLAELLLLECGNTSEKPPHEMLSDREYQVLRLIGSGKKVSDIARILFLSAKTVSTYRAHILEKMKLKNSAELTYYVMHNGLTKM